MTGSAREVEAGAGGAGEPDEIDMPTMEEIGTLCRSYADAREALEELTEEIAAERRAIVRGRLRALKAAVAKVAVAKDELRLAVSASPGLFVKPKTRAIEGIKVGFRKKPGRFEIPDVGRTIELIRKRLPDREDEIVRITESVDKAALKRLDTRSLARIGVTLVAVDDEIVVAAAASDLDKLVDALMADGDDE